MYYFACDIGGTKARIARSTNLETFDEPEIFDTPASPEEGLKVIAEKISTLADGGEISAVCLGIAGVLNSDHTALIKSPHLPDWENILIKEKIVENLLNIGANASSVKIYLENDANIVGLGEVAAGAAKGAKDVVYITISTGIGGVKIVDGKFDKNLFGFEPGFQILDYKTGENFEDLASGTAVANKFNMEPKEVAQTENWEAIVDIIATGLHNSIVHWSPELLVVGGSMSKDLRADILIEKISKLMKIHPRLPEIKIAELGTLGGLHGGLAFIKSQM